MNGGAVDLAEKTVQVIYLCMKRILNIKIIIQL